MNPAEMPDLAKIEKEINEKFKENTNESACDFEDIRNIHLGDNRYLSLVKYKGRSIFFQIMFIYSKNPFCELGVGDAGEYCEESDESV